MTSETQNGRVALITGGAGGIGQAMADSLLADGVRVVLMDLPQSAAEAVAATLGARTSAVLGDVADAADCARAIDHVLDRFGSLDVLINNAGIGASSIRPDAETNHPGLAEITPDTWRRFFDVNVAGPFMLTRLATPHMAKRGWGRVINNTTSFFTMLRLLPYGASKAALEAASAVWAAELDGTGVTVNVLVPGGPTDTPFIGAGSKLDRSKMLRPEVMGPPLRWLVSQAADRVTGRRFVGGHWDPRIDPAEAAEKAGAPIGWPDLSANVVWPD